MRAAALPLLALPLLLTYCGAKQDLFIGEVALVAEGGSTGASVSGGSAGTETATAGTAVGGGTGATGGDPEGGGEGGEAGGAGTGGEAGSSGAGCVPGERPPAGSLLHRYSFDGTGTVVTDSISGADGALVGGALLDGTGILSLNGTAGQYVDLPNGLVSSLTDLTVVTWVTWTGGAGYQRIFDFGISNLGEVIGGSGRSYFAVIPLTGFENGNAQGLGAEIKLPGVPSLQLASTESMRDRLAQIGFVFQGGQRVALYLDGNLLAESPTTIQLSDIDDRNNWLGQSQWQKDPPFRGRYDEFRIYDVALTRCQLATLLVHGALDPVND